MLTFRNSRGGFESTMEATAARSALFGLNPIEHLLHQFDTLRPEIAGIESFLKNLANVCFPAVVIRQQFFDCEVYFRQHGFVIDLTIEPVRQIRKLCGSGLLRVVRIGAHAG